MKKILVLIDNKWIMKDSLINNLRFDNYDFEYKIFNDIHVDLLNYKNELSKYNSAIVIDEHAIAPFMYLSKIKGLVPAPIYDEHSALMTAFHNNANVLCLGYKITGYDVLLSCIKHYLLQPFEGGRHYARLDMLKKELEVGK